MSRSGRELDRRKFPEPSCELKALRLIEPRSVRYGVHFGNTPLKCDRMFMR